MPNFTNNWADVFKKSIDQMKPLAGTKLDYLEIGIFEGQSAYMMFNNILTHPDCTYTGIDDWSSSKNHFGETSETLARKNLKPYKNATIITDRSRHTLEQFNKDQRSFDITYIDGNHSYQGVLSDTVLTWNMTKQIMIWDDYRNNNYGVKPAVRAFLRNFPNQYKVIVDDYQFAIQKLE